MKIAVLGLGRMGAAMAARLADQRWDVTGWTRSGRTVDSVKTTDHPEEAVADSDVVLLALYDGKACAQVLDRIRSSLRADAIVVNTATIAPAEASALASQFGAAYLHAPVLGSVPSVTAGTLEIIAGAQAGNKDALARVRPVLSDLGQVHPAADAASAAALKLVANCSLAGAIAALRDALRQGDALGLPRQQVLDVLELGQLGNLAARKRSFLADQDAGDPNAADPPPATFTIGALAKDMALLADASDSPLPSAADLAENPPEADVALIATAPAASEAVLAPLRAYIRGHATGDPVHFRDAFLPTAHVEGLRDGKFVSWNLDDYCALFAGQPAPDEKTRRRRIDAVDVRGSVATASMTLWHGADIFNDVFLLVNPGGRWHIANKAYHRR